MDLPSEVIQWLTGQLGLAGLAGFTMMMLNSNFQRALAREREYAEANREDKLKLFSVLAENTAALVRLTTVVENFMHNGNERGTDRRPTP